ncbi:Major Facilitator Superfamily protein [Aspergillus niger]|uniref:Major Facilitator Superfamily protein n=1 Tax=Aspergillus niger TaxID=5061 RepID=A0A505HXT8_ASPNG|nr:Major Facilitator Superfamily protein [Aspergillus niger]
MAASDMASNEYRGTSWIITFRRGNTPWSDSIIEVRGISAIVYFASCRSYNYLMCVNERLASALDHSLFGHSRKNEDPSILAAKEQVSRAEAAEREADRALMASKRAVREAREHVRRLDEEAKMEARAAKMKQDQVKSITKRAKPLGSF